MRLSGRNILVTGANQGIGRAITDAAIAEGARVIAVDLDMSTLTASEYLFPVVCDVSDPAAVLAAVTDALGWAGSIDGLVNNAGLARPGMIDSMPVDAWQQVIDVNLSGSFYMLQAVGRHMMQSAAPNRAIVNITSDAGRRGTFGQINYGAAKAGVVGLTMSAAREWAKHGIRVNAASFGVVNTSMTETIRQDRFRDTYLAQIPLGRFAEPQDVARPVLFLLSDDASYITGQTLSVNGGFDIHA